MFIAGSSSSLNLAVTPPRHTDAMLTKLLELTGTLEYEEDGWTTITSADWRGSDLILLLCVHVPGSPDSQFRIRCKQARSHHIIAAANDHLVWLGTEHVVLWPHNQQQNELYFNGTSTDALSLFGALIEAQRSVLGNWFPVDYFLNLPGRSTAILRGGHGLLAKGPESLLDTFGSILNNYGIKHSRLAPRNPVWWNGNQWTLENEQLHALIVGDSYVVASSFTEKRV